MKTFNSIFKILALTVCAAALMVSCEQEPDNVARAVLGDVSVMNFTAKNPAAKTVTVYSDGQWHTTAPEWITVDPNTGEGVMTVTVTASENVDAQGMLEPRKDTLIISGNTLASRLLIFVSQEGDAYRNAQHLTLDKVAELADGKSFILDEATVVALTSKGFVINAGTTNVYVESDATVKVGDVVSVKGIKGNINSLPSITQADDVTVKSAGTATYPEPTNINDVIATYTAGAMDYIKVSGIVTGKNLTVTVDEVDYSFVQVDTPSELSIASLNGNKVELTGYAAGMIGAKQFGILTTAVKDNGPAVVPRPEKLLYAKWRFTTSLYPNYASFFGGTSGVKDKAEGFSELYVPSNVEGNGKLTFYQIDKTAIDVDGKASRIIGGTGHPYVTGVWPGDYWQFSATDNYEYPAGTQLHIKYMTRCSGTGHKYWMLEYFDGAEWKPADELEVKTETETGTNAQYNFIEPTSNTTVECNWTLAKACREPKFRMRCVANWKADGSGALTAPNGGTCRISDNDDGKEDAGPVFEVVSAPEGGGGGFTSVTVFEDDFEWIEQWATAASAGDAVATNNPSTTAPNVFSSAACEGFLAAAVAKGYGYFWGPKDGNWSDSLGEDNPKVLYLQKNYLKFGKTAYNAGIKLPALSALSAKANVELTFDWCWQITGSNNADIMTLTILVDGDGSYAGGEITSAQSTESGASKIEWQHAKVTVSGVSPTTRLSICPTNADPKVSNPDRNQNRWYLDNIKIVTVE